MRQPANRLHFVTWDGIVPEGWRIVHPLMDGNCWTGAYVWRRRQ